MASTLRFETFIESSTTKTVLRKFLQKNLHFIQGLGSLYKMLFYQNLLHTPISLIGISDSQKIGQIYLHLYSQVYLLFLKNILELLKFASPHLGFKKIDCCNLVPVLSQVLPSCCKQPKEIMFGLMPYSNSFANPLPWIVFMLIPQRMKGKVNLKELECRFKRKEHEAF